MPLLKTPLSSAAILLLKTLLPLVLLAVLTEGKNFFGFCPKLQAQQNFDRQNFTNRWFVFAMYRLNHLPDIRCWRYKFNIVDGQFKFKSVVIEAGTNKKVVTRGRLLLAKGQPVDSASFRKKYRNHTAPEKPDFNILKTDYSTHAIVWACEQVFRFKKNDPQQRAVKNEQQLFILTRATLAVTDALKNRLYTDVEDLGLDKEKLKMMDLSQSCRDLI